MEFNKFASLGMVALKSNFTTLDRPYKLNFAITMWCQSKCLTCVRPEEIIIGDNKPISELNIGDKAVGHRDLNNIIQTFSRPYEGKLIKIMALGLLPVEVTPEHPLLVTTSKTIKHKYRLHKKHKFYREYKFSKPVWKKAEDITVKDSYKDGDYLCMPVINRKLKIKELDLSNYTKGHGIAISKGKGVSLKFPLNKDTAWLLGIYTARGGMASNGSEFSFNANETRLHNRAIKVAKDLGYFVSLSKRVNCVTYSLSSYVLSRAFADWCGNGALDKKIPDFILFNEDNKILSAFLKGWEEGEGYWKNNEFIGFTVSKTLAEQLQIAYVSLGVIAKVNNIKKSAVGKIDGRIFNMRNSYRIKYFRGIHKNYFRKFKNYLLCPIRNIEEIKYKGTVHNIETSDNTYLVSNAVVHNCNIWELKPKGELTLEEIRNFAKKNNYFKWLEITGGEPFLRSDIVEIVKTFHETSKDLYVVTIPTNSLTNPDLILKKVKEILDLGIPKLAITLSLDGYRELHDKIRGVNGNYDKVIALYRKLEEINDKRLLTVFGYTISKYNIGELEKTIEEVRREIPSVNYNDFHINLAQLSENYYHNEELKEMIKPNSKIVANEIRNLVKKRKRNIGAIPLIEMAFLKRLADFAETGIQPLKNKSLDASLFLDNFGNIYPSIMWNEKIGNLRDIDYDLSKVWQSDKANEIRKKIKEGKEEPNWTSCEAFQALTGNITSLL